MTAVVELILEVLCTDYLHDQLRGLAEVLVCILDLASETKTKEWNLLSTKKKT